jgi:hypothetical protein
VSELCIPRFLCTLRCYIVLISCAIVLPVNKSGDVPTITIMMNKGATIMAVRICVLVNILFGMYMY